jgi:CBS domain-containing membrane protein
LHVNFEAALHIKQKSFPVCIMTAKDLSHSSHEAEGWQHVEQLLHRLRVAWLLRHLPARMVWTAYVLLNGFVTIAVLSLLGIVTHSPFAFPSLGPTAYLFFFTPLAAASSPRNAILGHAVGLVCGYAAYHLVALHAASAIVHAATDWPRVLAGALSLSLTGAFMVLLRVSHPPAGATTLIVSLGILSTLQDVIIIEVAVVLLTAQAFVINRLAGLPYPLWHSISVTQHGSN